MKKLLAVVLALVMVLVFAACSSSEKEAAPSKEVKVADASVETSAGGALTSSGWPNKAITLICPYSAGGSSDLGCRYTAEALRSVLGVPVVVENVPGAAAWLGWEQLLASPKDGYTFALVNAGIVTGQYSDVDPKDKNENDFELLAAQVVDPQVICRLATETRYTDFKSFVEFCQNNSCVFASNGLNKLNPQAAFIDFMKVNYDVTLGPVSVDSTKDGELMFQSGDTDFFIGALSDATAMIENGTYEIIAVFSDNKPEKFPDAPLIEEVSGIRFPMNTVRGYAYPKGVDKEIVDAMVVALEKAINSETCVQQMANMNTVTTYADPEGCKILMVDEIQLRRELCGDV